MNGSWFTVLVGAILPILPQMLLAIPAPYKDLASAVIAAVVAAWHLYQPQPVK